MIRDFVFNTCNAPGTGASVNLIAAPTGRKNFWDFFSTGALAFYYMTDGVIFETGYGTLTTGSPNTFSRDTVLNNSSGTTSRLNFTASGVYIYNEIPASQMVYRDSAGLVTVADTSVSNTSALTITGTSNTTSGVALKLTGNGGTTPSKTIRVKGGALEIMNSAYGAAILTLTDAGALTIPGNLAVGSALTGSAGFTITGSTQVNIVTATLTQNGSIVALKSYVDSQDSSVTAAANSRMDSQDAAYYSAAQGYANSQDAAWYGVVGSNFLPNTGGLVSYVNTNGGTIPGGSGWGFTNAGALGTYGLGGVTCGIIAGGTGIIAGYGFFVVSDVRLKHDIKTIETAEALDWVMKSRPVSYQKRPKWDSPLSDSRYEVGFIAQEQIEIGFDKHVSFVDHEGMPELNDGKIVSNADKELNLNQGYQIAYLTTALQNALSRIEALEAGR